MAKKFEQPWGVEVIGEAESPFSGAVPENLDSLITKPDKDVKSLLYQVVKTQVELLCQSGDTQKAVEAINKYLDKNFEYACPKNTFKQDVQNGHHPYIGAHCVFGGIRDAASEAYNDVFKFYKKKGDKGPSDKHFRKYVTVKPNHIFFHRPDMAGSQIEKVDETEGQQPCPDVRGFAKYEVINPPFQFMFRVNLNPFGYFKDLLSDRDLIKAVIHQAVNHGLGARRSAGCGMWKIVSYKESG